MLSTRDEDAFTRISRNLEWTFSEVKPPSADPTINEMSLTASLLDNLRELFQFLSSNTSTITSSTINVVLSRLGVEKYDSSVGLS